MELVALAPADRKLLEARYAEHGNSHRRMHAALLEAGAADAAARLHALRSLEAKFDLDLGQICHRFAQRAAPGTHPIERVVIDYITELQTDASGADILCVLPERVRQVHELMQGRLVGERD